MTSFPATLSFTEYLQGVVVKVNVRFYSPSACGFYPARGRKRFGSLKYAFYELKDWGTGLDLIDTKLPYKEDTLPAYLASVESRSGVYVVVLWIEVPSGADNSVASIQAHAPVGRASTMANSIAPGTIPGFPCYFAAIPDEGVVMSIRIDDSVMGLNQFQGYVESFLATSSPAVRVDADDESKIVAYADELGDEHDDVQARFSLRLVRHGEQSDFIIQHAHLVRKIVRVRTLESNRPQDRSLWQGLVDELGFTSRPEQTMRTRIKYEMGVSAQPAQIVQIVNDHAESAVAQKDDYGFVMEGDPSTTHWLSNAIASLELDLQLGHERRGREGGEGMVSPSQLLDRLVQRKAQLLEAAGSVED